MKISLQLNTGHNFIGKSFCRELINEENEYGEIVFQLEWLVILNQHRSVLFKSNISFNISFNWKLWYR